MLKNLILPVLATTLLLSFPALAADWQPAFTPGQAVYIDPALVNSQQAPVKFGSELEQSVKALEKKNGINYYVWAVETTNAPANKPLGVAKADEAIAAWNGLPGFPTDNYALIVWARRAENPAKGGIGINVSKDLKKFDVTPILKENMPRNPKGAITAIAQRIGENKEADILLENSNRFAAWILGSLVALAGLFWFLKFIVDALQPNFTFKENATTRVGRWGKTVENLTDIHLDLTSDSTLEFYSSLNKDGELADLILKNNEAINRFLCLYQAIEFVHKKASDLILNGKYKKAVSELDEMHSVDFGKLPLEKASIYTGLSDIKQYPGDRLLDAAEKQFSEVQGNWALFKQAIGASNPEKAIADLLKKQKDELAAKQKRKDDELAVRRAEEKRQRQLDLVLEMQRREKRKAESLKSPNKVNSRQNSSSSTTVNNTTVVVDNSSSSRHSSSSSSDSSWPSSDSSSSSSSDWGSSGSDYSGGDSFGGDY